MITENKLVRLVVVSAITGALFGYLGGVSAGKRLQGGSVLPEQPISIVPAGGFSNEESQVISVVEKASPAVVSIVATQDIQLIERGYVNPLQNFCGDPFFRQFFGGQCNIPSQPQQPKTRTEQRQISAGTGFLVSSAGMIVTNKHVVALEQQGASFTVITSNDKKYPARVLAKDPIHDIAIIKIDAKNLSFLKLGDSSKIKVGQSVIAIGNALGQLSNSVSKGIISGLSRSIVASDGAGSSERLSEIMQTDAAINHGNSGGPLLNMSGEVIGINTAIAEGAQSVGFAIPVNLAKRDIEQVKSSGKISYPYLGVRYAPVDAEMKDKNNLTVDYGALVIRGQAQNDLAVIPGSPADKAGIRENDIILEIDGTKIDADHELSQIIQNKKVGDVIRLKILSQGEEKTVSATLEERE